MSPSPTLVVGSGGLLGSALVRRLVRENRPVVTARVPWSRPDAVRAALAEAVDRLLAVADGGDWSVAWCAGAAVTGATQPVLDAELVTLRQLLSDHVVRADGGGRGRVFYASSAGGVYGGSVHPPFDETSAPRPLGPYGVAKLAAEDAVRSIAGSGGVDVVVGRIANLYGPGQDLAKPQGLISQLCRAHVVGQPLNLYVPLDTIRDYLYVDDCAAMVDDALTLPGGGGSVVVKVMASLRPATIGAVLGECRRVFGRRPRVVLGSSPVARQQARDLRLRSVVLPSLDARATTTLAAGIHSTLVAVTGALHGPPRQLSRPARSGAA